MRDPAQAFVEVSVECERMGPPAMTVSFLVLKRTSYPTVGRGDALLMRRPRYSAV